MRTSIMRWAVVAGLSVVATAGIGAPAHAEPEPGCVGLPDSGGYLYQCVDENVAALLPKVSVGDPTSIPMTVPAVCYLVSCTQPVTVDTAVPQLFVSRPTSDVTVFELRMHCYPYYGCYGAPSDSYYSYYGIYYSASSGTCRIESDNPNLSALESTTVPCTV